MTTPYAPQPISPSQDGQLCNQHGANTGADAILSTWRYLNPAGSADRVAGMRTVVYRTEAKGVAQAPELAWDSGWAGAPSTSPLPSGLSFKPGASTVYGGRVYVATAGTVQVGPVRDGILIYSAPVAGTSTGSWRSETAPPLLSTGPNAATLQCPSLLAMNGYMYAFAWWSGGGSGNGIYFARINGDGTFGGWSPLQSQPTANTGCTLIGGSDGLTYAWIAFIGSGNSEAGYAPISLSSGYLASGWTATTNLPTSQPNNCPIYDQANGKVIVLPGDTTAATTVYYATVNATTGVIGAYSTSGAPLTAARKDYAACLSNGRVYVMGGNNGSADQSTVYSATPAVIETTGAGSWTTDSHSLPSALSSLAGYALPNAAYVGVAGGAQATVYEAPSGVSGLTAAFNSGAASELSGGSLGTGGVVANDPAGARQGSVDVTFAYGAFGNTPNVASFSDGDQIQETVYFADLNGDISSAGTAIISIGQPPTITSPTSGAVTTGQPTLGMGFVPGAGGAQQATWRIQVKNGSTVIFDTGVTLGWQNGTNLLLAPMLASATGYTVVYTVASGDTPMTGSSASATSTQTVTPSYTAPAVPTSPSATPNNATGAIAVGWTNPGGSTATGNRVYYRRNGTSAWFLLADSQPTGTIGSPTSQTYYDQLVPSIAYDFAVSAITASGESALSTVVTNVKIDPIAGGWPAMLHVLGAGATQATMRTRDTPKWKRLLASELVMVAATAAPKARFGIADSRSVELSLLTLSVAELDALQAVLAQAKKGKTLVYRDSFGTYVTCAPMGEQGIEYRAPATRFPTLRLQEVPNSYAPNVGANLVATGLLAVTDGAVAPLASDELAL